MKAKKEREILEKQFEYWHDNPPVPFNGERDPYYHEKAIVVDAIVNAHEPIPSHETRAWIRKQAHASVTAKPARFASVVFIQGDDAHEPLRILNRGDGEEAAIAYLAQWDNGEEYEVLEHGPWGESDRLYGYGDYVLSYNTPLGYIGLTRIIR